MKLVFDKFKDNLFTANHSFNVSSSLLTIILSWTMSLPEQKIVVSSAKKDELQYRRNVVKQFRAKY